jgi:hypothetical protein
VARYAQSVRRLIFERSMRPYGNIWACLSESCDQFNSMIVTESSSVNFACFACLLYVMLCVMLLLYCDCIVHDILHSGTLSQLIL